MKKKCRSRTVAFRLSDEELKVLEEEARKEELSPAQYMRKLATKKSKVEQEIAFLKTAVTSLSRQLRLTRESLSWVGRYSLTGFCFSLENFKTLQCIQEHFAESADEELIKEAKKEIENWKREADIKAKSLFDKEL